MKHDESKKVKQFIRENCVAMSDSEIAAHFNMKRYAVVRLRQSLGIKKNARGQITQIETEIESGGDNNE